MTNMAGKINKQIGLKIKLERTKRSWSQEQLAEYSNLNKNSIGAIERGESSPTIETLDKIAKALDIPLHELTNITKVEID